jgi:hypothetical protein
MEADTGVKKHAATGTFHSQDLWLPESASERYGEADLGKMMKWEASSSEASDQRKCIRHVVPP